MLLMFYQFVYIYYIWVKYLFYCYFVHHNSTTKDGFPPFYHGRVSTATGTALIFISLGILPILRSSEELTCDATFATLPFFSQLFTIHVDAYTYVRKN